MKLLNMICVFILCFIIMMIGHHVLTAIFNNKIREIIGWSMFIVGSIGYVGIPILIVVLDILK